MNRRATGHILETVIVAALVFGIGWAATRLAEAAHTRPVKEDHQGMILLNLAKSDRVGNVTFEEGDNYRGWWHCTGTWRVEWNLEPKSAGFFSVRASVSHPENLKGKKIRISLGSEKLTSVIGASGKKTDWFTLDFGRVQLEAQPYKISIFPEDDPDGGSLNVRSITLQREDSTQ